MDESMSKDEELDMPNEKKAIAAGLALLAADYNGESDFEKGMRQLQKMIRDAKR